MALWCCLLAACATQQYDPRPVSAEAIAQRIDSRSLDAPELRARLAARGLASAQGGPPSWDLDSLTVAALFFNADIAAARARLASAQAAEITAAQRPNPVLQLPLQRAANPRNGESPWILGLALDIPIETAGKRGHRMKEAAQLAAAARFQLAQTAWNLRSRLREQLLSLWSASQRQALLRQQLASDDSLVAMLEKRLAAGYASAPEANQQRLARMQDASDLLAAQRDIATARAGVAAVLGLRADALANVGVDLQTFEVPALEPPGPDLRLQALLNRADLREGLAQYEATQEALQREIARQYPDLHLGPGYTLDQGVRKIGLDFSGIELPVFHRNAGPIAEARARREEARARVEQLQAKAFADIDGALTLWQATRGMAQQMESQLALQRRRLATAQRAFELGQEDRLSATLAQKAELVARLARLDAAVQMQQALGRIEDAMQRPLSGAAAPIDVSEAMQ
jgi:outer membrane protein TolC